MNQNGRKLKASRSPGEIASKFISEDFGEACKYYSSPLSMHLPLSFVKTTRGSQ